MRDFGESLLVYRPPIDTRCGERSDGPETANGNPEKALNFLTPHQKWGIHSTYSDNLLMLTLGRGGPVVWLSEADAKELGIADNDWIEVFNSQRCTDCPCGCQPACSGRDDHDVPRAGTYR